MVQHAGTVCAVRLIYPNETKDVTKILWSKYSLKENNVKRETKFMAYNMKTVKVQTTIFLRERTQEIVHAQQSLRSFTSVSVRPCATNRYVTNIS